MRCRDAERAILPGIRCPVCLLVSVFRRIPGIPVVKIVPGIDLYSDNYTKKKKPGFRKFRSDSGFQTGIHPESTRNRWGSVKTSIRVGLLPLVPLEKWSTHLPVAAVRPVLSWTQFSRRRHPLPGSSCLLGVLVALGPHCTSVWADHWHGSQAFSHERCSSIWPS